MKLKLYMYLPIHLDSTVRSTWTVRIFSTRRNLSPSVKWTPSTGRTMSCMSRYPIWRPTSAPSSRSSANKSNFDRTPLICINLTKTRNPADHLSLYLSASSLINDDWRILSPKYHQNHPPPHGGALPMPLPRYKLLQLLRYSKCTWWLQPDYRIMRLPILRQFLSNRQLYRSWTLWTLSQFAWFKHWYFVGRRHPYQRGIHISIIYQPFRGLYLCLNQHFRHDSWYYFHQRFQYNFLNGLAGGKFSQHIRNQHNQQKWFWSTLQLW